MTTATTIRRTTTDSFYVTGGTLPSDASSYVVRQTDTDLLDGLLKGEFCYLLNTRQMGKSSLMIRTAAKLREQGGVAVAVLDLTAIGQNLSPEQWYDGLLVSLGEQLGLDDELDDFWGGNANLGPMQRFFAAVGQVVLPALGEQRLVVFVDEIDAVRSLPFSADEFFAGIRECYNRRRQDQTWERLTFCLLGVATPADLISDTRMSPFNIGRRIVIADFTPDEAAPLASGLGQSGEALLARVLYWTGGHPYMTQRLCHAVAGEGTVQSTRAVDRLCDTLFLSRSARDTDDNLAFVRNRLLRSEVDLAGLLDLYTQVRQSSALFGVRAGKKVKDDETIPLVPVLRLSGVVKVENGFLKVRNHIYDRVFDKEWVIAHMPDAELRRQKAAYRRGLVRAASVGTVVVVMMALLAAAALSQAARANRATDAAQGNLRVANTQTQKATRLAERLRDSLQAQRETNRRLAVALADTRRERNRANNEAARANNETGRARASEVRERAQKRQAEVARAEAVRGRLTALAAQRRAVAAGQEALAERREALRQKGEAVARREESRRRLVRMNVATGERLMEEGAHFGALLWFAEARRLDGGAPERDRMHQTRLASVLRRTPRLTQLWFHKKRVQGAAAFSPKAAFSPDGRRVLTTSEDNTARVWDARTGKPVGLPMAHDNSLSFAAFSPDGSRVVTSSSDRTARVWDAATGKPLTEPIKHEADLRTALFFPDGKRLLTASIGPGNVREYRIYDAATGKLLTANLTQANVAAAGISEDRRRVAVANTSGNLRVYDSESGKPVSPPTKLSMPPWIVQFSPDGKKVAALLPSRDKVAALLYSRDAAQVFEVETGKPLTGEFKAVNSPVVMAFSPDGSRLAIGSIHERMTRVFDAATGTPITPPMKHERAITAIAFSPDGRHVVTTSHDFAARVWDAQSGDPVSPPLNHGAFVLSASFSPDGRRVLTAATDGTARVYDLSTTDTAAPVLTYLNAVLWAAFSPDGRTVAATSADNTARVWDAATGRALTEPLIHSGGGDVLHAAFSPEGRTLVTSGGDKTARLWDPRTGKALQPPLLHERAVRWAAFSPDGRRLVTATGEDNAPGEARVWDVATGKPLLPPFKHVGPLHRAVFSPDGRRILTAGGKTTLGDYQGETRLWDAATGKPLTAVIPLDAPARHAAFSPDGRRFVVACDDGSFSPRAAHVFDTATGKALRTLRHADGVRWAAFSPDGRRIVTASEDSTARVWDARTGRPLTPPMRHHAIVRSAAFSPDGTRVVTGGDDSIARVWDARTGEPLTPPLRQAGPVNMAAWNPDGHRFVTASGIANTGGGEARIWEAGEDARPAADLLRMIQLLSGQRIDATAGAVPLEGDAVRTGLEDLRARYPRDFAPATKEMVAWHRHAAAALDQAGLKDWSEAHLNVAVELNPDDWETYLRRAHLYSSQQKYEKAVADHSRAVALNPEDLVLRLRRQGIYGVLRQWDNAIADQTKMIEIRPEIASFYYYRAHSYMQSGQWQNAVADFTRAIELDPTLTPFFHFRASAYAEMGQWEQADADFARWRQFAPDTLTSHLALARLARGDAAGYAQEFARVLARFGETNASPELNVMAWTGSLLPGAISDPARLVTMAEKAVASEPGNAAYIGTLGAALVRAGRPEEAVKRLEESVSLQGKGGSPRFLLFLALAHSGLGHADAARENRDKAAGKIAEAFQRNQSAQGEGLLTWHERTELEVLLAQALKEIPGGGPAGTPPAVVALSEQLRRRYPPESLVAPDQKVLAARARAAFRQRIPRRDPGAGPDQIDLSEHYNALLTESWHHEDRNVGNDLSLLPRGLQTLGGTLFDIHGVIQVGSGPLEAQGLFFPRIATGIPVGRACSHLSFLLGTGWSVNDGTQIGEFVLHYENGETRRVPMVYGRDVRDWWTRSDPKSSGDATPVWIGTNRNASASNTTVRLYKMTAPSPLPGVKITSLDFESRMTGSAPFLIAVTVQ